MHDCEENITILKQLLNYCTLNVHRKLYVHHVDYLNIYGV